MATYFQLSKIPVQIEDSTTAAPASGYTLESYLAGTTTPTSMFSDNVGTVIGAAVTTNSAGYPQVSGSVVNIWLDAAISYKFVLKDASNVTVWTVDNVSIQAGGLLFESYESMASLIAASPSFDLVYVQSYYGGWAATVTGPTGGHYRHKTGATNASPSVGSPVSVSTIGTGNQAGYCWDANGEEWKISEKSRYPFYDFGAVWDNSTDDHQAIQDCLDFLQAKGYGIAEVPVGEGYCGDELVITDPIHISGAGFVASAVRKGSSIRTDLSSGTLLTLSNVTSSFDSGLILEDFILVGSASGTCDGLKVSGGVWANTRIQNITVRQFGRVGIVIDDCLTASFINCRTQANNSHGFTITGSNGLRLIGCMAESNGGNGYRFSASPTEGDNGPAMIGCHAEENTGGDAVYFSGYQNLMIQGCWLQVANTSNDDRAAIHLDTTTGAMISGNYLTTNSSFSLFSGVKYTSSQRCSVICNTIREFSALRGIVEDAGSQKNISFGNIGDGASGELGFTTSSSSGSTYHNHMGTNNGQEWLSNRHSFQSLDGTERGRFDETTTAGDTSLVLYDVDSGSVQRVSVGSASSGGSGFKVLRVPN